MTTTSPSWFPSWPASFPDLEEIYLKSVPRQFPWGLYEDETTDEYKDIQAMAVVFSWVAQGGEWIKRRIFPQFDSGAMFLGLWEECYNIARRATTAARQNAIIAYMRHMRGTATKEQLQAIFAPIFDEADPSKILFAWATPAQIHALNPDTQAEYNAGINSLHVYHTTGNIPDWAALWDTIRAVQPTWIRMSGGEYKTLKWDTQGGWDTACWGP
jgi:hypothetical protein